MNVSLPLGRRRETHNTRLSGRSTLGTARPTPSLLPLRTEESLLTATLITLLFCLPCGVECLRGLLRLVARLGVEGNGMFLEAKRPVLVRKWNLQRPGGIFLELLIGCELGASLLSEPSSPVRLATCAC